MRPVEQAYVGRLTFRRPNGVVFGSAYASRRSPKLKANPDRARHDLIGDAKPGSVAPDTKLRRAGVLNGLLNSRPAWATPAPLLETLRGRAWIDTASQQSITARRPCSRHRRRLTLHRLGRYWTWKSR